MIDLYVTPISNPVNNLSEEEKKRCALYRFEKDALLFASSRSWLKEKLSRYLGKAPPEIQIGAYGKPYLENCPLFFNLSHSAPWRALIFSWNYPVGVDIETMRELPDMENLILVYFSIEERAYVEQGSSLERCSRFWLVWCRKEACLKARGGSLDFSFNSLGNQMEEWFYIKPLQVWVRSYSHPEYALAAAHE